MIFIGKFFLLPYGSLLILLLLVNVHFRFTQSNYYGSLMILSKHFVI